MGELKPYCNLDPTRTLPAFSCRDPAWLPAEIDHIWYGDCVLVTTEDAISKPGDQLPVLVGNQPVLLVRNQEGVLTALSNLCAHRRALLVEEPMNGKRIVCPYHAWIYDDAGQLVACSFRLPGTIDCESRVLLSYLVESWHRLVFASLNQDVERLYERFAVVGSYVNEWELDAVDHGAAIEVNETWDCNWKAASQCHGELSPL